MRSAEAILWRKGNRAQKVFCTEVSVLRRIVQVWMRLLRRGAPRNAVASIESFCWRGAFMGERAKKKSIARRVLITLNNTGEVRRSNLMEKGWPVLVRLFIKKKGCPGSRTAFS